MGIRIKKVLCFALGDVKVKKFSIVDPRFQSWVNENNEIYERPRKMFRPFLDWIMDESKEQEKIDILASANGPSKNFWHSWPSERFFQVIRRRENP